MNDADRVMIEGLRDVLPQAPVFQITFADDEATYLNSHIGGSFYWPDTETPKLKFLAQINFAELPLNDILPDHGLLQFFIADDDAYGLFSKNGSLVVYHEEIRDDGIEVLTSFRDSPIVCACRMNFVLSKESLSFSDYRFTDYFDEYGLLDSFVDAVYEAFSGTGSKVLGYPFFTQYDPRCDGIYRKYDTLLFQLDSDDNHVMWGDCGVGNFFIASQALKNGDFSDILYSWDCC